MYPILASGDIFGRRVAIQSVYFNLADKCDHFKNVRHFLSLCFLSLIFCSREFLVITSLMLGSSLSLLLQSRSPKSLQPIRTLQSGSTCECFHIVSWYVHLTILYQRAPKRVELLRKQLDERLEMTQAFNASLGELNDKLSSLPEEDMSKVSKDIKVLLSSPYLIALTPWDAETAAFHVRL